MFKCETVEIDLEVVSKISKKKDKVSSGVFKGCVCEGMCVWG